MQEILGVDYGGVICSLERSQGVFHPLEGAFAALRRLREERFGKVVVISRIENMSLRGRIIAWFHRNNFWRATGIVYPDLHFCVERHEKSHICRQLGVTHFIDDRSEVLEHLMNTGIANLYLFQGRANELAARAHILNRFAHVSSWQEVAEKLLAGLRERRQP